MLTLKQSFEQIPLKKELAYVLRMRSFRSCHLELCQLVVSLHRNKTVSGKKDGLEAVT